MMDGRGLIKNQWDCLFSIVHMLNHGHCLRMYNNIHVFKDHCMHGTIVNVIDTLPKFVLNISVALTCKWPNCSPCLVGFRQVFRLPQIEKLDGNIPCTLWTPYNKTHVNGVMYLSRNYICFASRVSYICDIQNREIHKKIDMTNIHNFVNRIRYDNEVWT